MGVTGYKIVECESLKSYKNFIANNPYIEIISTFSCKGVVGEVIVITYRGQLGNPSSKSRRMM
jgi:hypothetical protein